MKLRPSFTVPELQKVIAALIKDGSPESVPIINRLDLMLYRARTGDSEVEAKELAAQIDKQYAECSSIEEAVEKLGKGAVVAILKRKDSATLTKDEIGFIGEFLMENL